MTDAILNSKRRLERHMRRDGQLQSRARPASVERRADDESPVAYIRNSVENFDLARRLVTFGSITESSGKPSKTDISGTTRKGGSGESSTASATHSFARNSAANPVQETTSATPTTTAQQVTSTTPTTTRVSHSHTTSSSVSTAPVLTTTAAALPTTTSSSSSSSISLSTAVAFVTATASQSAGIAASSSTTTSKPDSSGVGVGPIIGIVAGSLAGVAILAALIGFLFKKYGRKEDPYEADPFNPDDFRRQSAMLPETFDSDEGHNSMSEYRNMSPFGNEAGYGAAAGVGAMAGGMAAASSFTSHNESGGPRPPTMFQKHINGQASQYNNNEPMPTIGAVYNPNEISPQLPVMAFGGSDPYSIAGVGRNHQMDSNINNPYAHLDRSPSAMVQRNVSQVGQQVYPGPERSNGSNGSSYKQYSSEHYQSAGHEIESAGHGYDTAGRPGTAEGRSGTPDLPNVQQTYAGTGTNEHQEMDRVVSPHHMMASPEQMPHEYYSQSGYQDENSAPQQPLQVRNLLPNPHQMHQQRMSATSNQANEEDAYGGVW